MNFKTPIFAIIILIWICSCDPLIISPVNVKENSIVCILRPYLSEQRLYIYNVLDDLPDSIQSLSNFGEKEISNSFFNNKATVKILYNGFEYDFSYSDTENKKVFINYDLNIQYEEEYSLHIQSDKIEIYGHTKIPSNLIITEPSDSVLLISREINLKWNKIENSKNYLIRIKGPLIRKIFNLSDTIITSNIIKTDRIINNQYKIVIPKNNLENNEMIKSEYIYDPLEYKITITAIDTNLYNYLSGEKISGLNTGYGVFGSAVADSISILIPSDSLKITN